MDWAMVKVKVRFRDKKRDKVSRYKAIVKFVFLLKEYPFCFYVLNFSTFLNAGFLEKLFWEDQELQNFILKASIILRKKNIFLNFLVWRNFFQIFKFSVFSNCFLIMVDLYTKMCRIKFQETLRMNVGALDLSEKSYLWKTFFFIKFKVWKWARVYFTPPNH